MRPGQEEDVRVETEGLPMAAALKGPVHATEGGTTPSPGGTGALRDGGTAHMPAGRGAVPSTSCGEEKEEFNQEAGAAQPGTRGDQGKPAHVGGGHCGDTLGFVPIAGPLRRAANASP